MSNAWIDQIFQAQAAKEGGVVRRSAHDVARFASLDELVQEAKERSFHVIETGDQVVVLCNEGEIKIHH